MTRESVNRIRIRATRAGLHVQAEAYFGCELIVVSGENGAGKTTLLRYLAGLESASGEIMVGGRLWLDSQAGFALPPELRRVGCVWADAALLPWLTVEGNLLLGAERIDRDWLTQLCEQLEIAALMQRRPHMLSTGEQQRVALARALYRKPDALLLDEPFSAQAPAIRQRLRAVLKFMQAALELPVIMVSHDAGDARALADQHWRMREGKLLTGVPHAPILSAADAR